MSYIKQLQKEKKIYHDAFVVAQRELNDFICFLGTSKFVGTESDGSRKDWISTTDVINRLKEIRGKIIDVVIF